MAYSERFADDESRQVYQELVFHSLAHHPSGEGALIAELLSRDHLEPAQQKRPLARLTWKGIFRLPLFSLPSLT